MTKDVFQIIDKNAVNFFETKNEKYFTAFAKVATPLIKAQAVSVCGNSDKWDTEELFAILFADMWRLFNAYKPEEGKQFHWLMQRQLKNKTINYINNKTERKYKICFVCNTTQSEKAWNAEILKNQKKQEKVKETANIENSEEVDKYTPDKYVPNSAICWKCGASLRKPHASSGNDILNFIGAPTVDYLEYISNKQIMEKLLQHTKKHNPTTNKILLLFLEGYSKTEVSKKVKIAQNAINFRLLKCRQIIGDFI